MNKEDKTPKSPVIELWSEVNGQRQKVAEITLEKHTEQLEYAFANARLVLQRLKKEVEERKAEKKGLDCHLGLIGSEESYYANDNIVYECKQKKCGAPCCGSRVSTYDYPLSYWNSNGNYINWEPTYIFPTNKALENLTQHKNNISKLLVENWKQLGIV